jgi:tRNA dimethylallyltransferase
MSRFPPRAPARPPPKPAPSGAPPLLALVGPTASGKTALGIALARALGGEIVSADSQQVYRLLEIGTAKPTAEERAAVPHHLLDVADPAERLSAGEFARLADQAIEGIRARGLLPIVVGGTGLWLRALLLGIVETPPADPQLRARLEREAESLGRPAMHARLAQLDPETAVQIPPQNLVRVVRALEIHALTGQRPSELRASHGFGQLRYRARVLGISPPREELYRRIDRRARAMFEAGLADEVRGLVERGLRDAPALRALGYPQALDLLEGRATREGAIAATAQASRHYAKRQLTWFRADPLVEWIDWPPRPEALAARLRAEGLG